MLPVCLAESIVTGSPTRTFSIYQHLHLRPANSTQMSGIWSWLALLSGQALVAPGCRTEPEPLRTPAASVSLGSSLRGICSPQLCAAFRMHFLVVALASAPGARTRPEQPRAHDIVYSLGTRRRKPRRRRATRNSGARRAPDNDATRQWKKSQWR